MASNSSTTTSKNSAKDAPSSTTIFLVRHGQTPTTGQVLPGRAPGLHLAEEGIEQARLAGKRLAELSKIDALYTSPLERAQDTAAPIAEETGVAAVVEEGLIECDFGEWTGKKLAELMKKPEWQTVQRAPSTFRFPGGESFTEMQVRMVTTLESIRDRHPGGTVVCVSHADCIKAVVAHAVGTHLDLFQRIVISTASVSAISWSAVGPVSLCVNSTGRSLAELAPS